MDYALSYLHGFFHLYIPILVASFRHYAWHWLKSLQTMAFEFSGSDILSRSSSESSLIHLYYASLFILLTQQNTANKVLKCPHRNSFQWKVIFIILKRWSGTLVRSYP